MSIQVYWPSAATAFHRHKGNAPCKSRATILFREGGPTPLSTGTHMHTHTDTSSIYIML